MAPLRLLQLLFQFGLRSNVYRKNFSLIEAFANFLSTKLDSFLSLPPLPIGNEVSNARDYHENLRSRLRSVSKALPNLVIEGGEVSPHPTLPMRLKISGGEAVVNGTGCKWGDLETGEITPPSDGFRNDLVVVNSDNSVSLLTGAVVLDLVNLLDPFISDSQKVLARLKLSSGQTEILPEHIKDLRRSFTQTPRLWDQNSVPVGSVVAWHKNFGNTPKLLENFAECNGQTLDDPESPYHGQVIPKLNENSSEGGLFLRGIREGGESGEVQDDQNKSHNHDVNDPGHYHTVPTHAGNVVPSDFRADYSEYGTSDLLHTNTAATGISMNPEGGAEARPINMSVVWVIRIK